ncbi:MAG: hypothetical protein A3H60_01580 [Candidatus Zambryskibacteria bacterium RIFCSPLOWO2_02_FULL_44_12b]|uniref:Uncharacterized protein n=1 Tax=Candidatus Zambryskibacteria bacterium RIFCSPLOWO2_02_FULL_44_12b TaxID=1802772 RepID=A0A1G2UQF5_9BACT|nr:MAG: hypothetical protein A3H60_01580 [Candidatus Zambryskibacteria bacterium RIFCSPLOWO2_02_FULL_44_12b]
MYLTMRNKIMFGVYLMYLIRKLKSPFFAESFIFAIIGMVLFYFVSVPSVLANMRASKSFYTYFMEAFVNADFLVQSILVLALITALFFVRNITVHAILKTRLV